MLKSYRWEQNDFGAGTLSSEAQSNPYTDDYRRGLKGSLNCLVTKEGNIERRAELKRGIEVAREAGRVIPFSVTTTVDGADIVVYIYKSNSNLFVQAFSGVVELGIENFPAGGIAPQTDKSFSLGEVTYFQDENKLFFAHIFLQANMYIERNPAGELSWNSSEALKTTDDDNENDLLTSIDKKVPAVVTVFQGRRLHIGFEGHPLRVIASEVGNKDALFEDESKGDAGAFVFSISATEQNLITHALPSLEGLFLFSAENVWRVGPSFSPSTLQVLPLNFGGTTIPPIKISDGFVYLDNAKDLYLVVQQSEDTYQRHHLSRNFSSLEKVSSMAWNPAKNILWCLVGGPEFFSFTFVPENGIAAWMKHEFYGGREVDGSTRTNIGGLSFYSVAVIQRNITNPEGAGGGSTSEVYEEVFSSSEGFVWGFSELGGSVSNPIISSVVFPGVSPTEELELRIEEGSTEDALTAEIRINENGVAEIGTSLFRFYGSSQGPEVDDVWKDVSVGRTPNPLGGSDLNDFYGAFFSSSLDGRRGDDFIHLTYSGSDGVGRSIRVFSAEDWEEDTEARIALGSDDFPTSTYPLLGCVYLHEGFYWITNRSTGDDWRAAKLNKEGEKLLEISGSEFSDQAWLKPGFPYFFVYSYSEGDTWLFAIQKDAGYGTKYSRVLVFPVNKVAGPGTRAGGLVKWMNILFVASSTTFVAGLTIDNRPGKKTVYALAAGRGVGNVSNSQLRSFELGESPRVTNTIIIFHSSVSILESENYSGPIKWGLMFMKTSVPLPPDFSFKLAQEYNLIYEVDNQDDPLEYTYFWYTNDLNDGDAVFNPQNRKRTLFTPNTKTSFIACLAKHPIHPDIVDGLLVAPQFIQITTLEASNAVTGQSINVSWAYETSETGTPTILWELKNEDDEDVGTIADPDGSDPGITAPSEAGTYFVKLTLTIGTFSDTEQDASVVSVVYVPPPPAPEPISVRYAFAQSVFQRIIDEKGTTIYFGDGGKDEPYSYYVRGDGPTTTIRDVIYHSSVINFRSLIEDPATERPSPSDYTCRLATTEELALVLAHAYPLGVTIPRARQGIINAASLLTIPTSPLFTVTPRPPAEPLSYQAVHWRTPSPVFGFHPPGNVLPPGVTFNPFTRRATVNFGNYSQRYGSTNLVYIQDLVLVMELRLGAVRRKQFGLFSWNGALEVAYDNP